MNWGRLTPLYFKHELIPVQVTLLPSLTEQLLSSNEISLESTSKAVVASITATGRDLQDKSFFVFQINLSKW